MKLVNPFGCFLHRLYNAISIGLYTFSLFRDNEKVPRPFRLVPFQINQISGRLKNMTVPSEFAGQPRGLDELKRWNATELKEIFIVCRSNCL